MKAGAETVELVEPGAVVDAALALVETQLLAQVAEDANLDGRTTGLLGFSGALVAASVAAKELIGFLWFVPLLVLGAVTLVFLWILYGGARFRGLLAAVRRPPNRVDLGVDSWAFYKKLAGASALKARESLLEELAKAFEENAIRIGRKQRRLQAATIALIAGLAVAGILIAVDTPTRIKPCVKSHPKCHRDRQGSNTSGLAGRSPKTDGGAS